MSDFDRYLGQNCRCGNDPSCYNCGSGEECDRNAGSPKPGDMIARNPKNHDDKWLVAAQYFLDNFEPIEDEE